MSTYKISEVHTDWRCDRCLWAKSMTVKFSKPLDWIRWSDIASRPPVHRCLEEGKLQLQSIQWIET